MKCRYIESVILNLAAVFILVKNAGKFKLGKFRMLKIKEFLLTDMVCFITKAFSPVAIRSE